MAKVDYPTMYKVQKELQKAVKHGEIQRLPCEVCGHEKSEGHHDDYSKPLSVRWLCRRHHREVHRGNHLVSNGKSQDFKLKYTALIALRLTPADFKMLAELAKANSRKVSDMARIIVVNHINNNKERKHA